MTALWQMDLVMGIHLPGFTSDPALAEPGIMSALMIFRSPSVEASSKVDRAYDPVQGYGEVKGRKITVFISEEVQLRPAMVRAGGWLQVCLPDASSVVGRSLWTRARLKVGCADLCVRTPMLLGVAHA